MIENYTTIKVTSTKLNSSIEFYQDVNVMNYVLNEYVLPGKLVVVTKTENNNLTITTSLKFASEQDYNDFRNDPVIKDFGITKKEFNDTHGIISIYEIINE